MGRFRYRALDADGREIEGVCEGDDEAAARQALRANGLVPLSLVAQRERGARLFGGARRWPRSERVLFARQLSAMLLAGMPLEAALTALLEQAEQAASRAVLARLRRGVAAGAPLSAAMAEQPEAFEPMFCAMVRVAEKTGRLDEILDDLAGHLEAADTFRQKLTVALIYPGAILVVALLVVAALLVYVVPQIVEVFARQQQTLPLLTRGLILLSDAVRVGFWPLLVLFAGGAFALQRAWRSPAGRARLLAALGRLPAIGRLLRISGTQRLAATLGIALRGGVPLVPALHLSAEVLTLPGQKQAVSQLIEAVGRGASLTAALTSGRDAPLRRFEPGLKHFVVLGERNGRLADMLGEVSRQQRAALEYRLGWLTGLLEPALVVAMGGLVLTIVLAVLLPIIEVNQFLR